MESKFYAPGSRKSCPRKWIGNDASIKSCPSGSSMASDPSQNAVFHVMQASYVSLATFNCFWHDQNIKVGRTNSRFGIMNRDGKRSREVFAVFIGGW